MQVHPSKSLATAELGDAQGHTLHTETDELHVNVVQW
jgi:hypothetical protein